MAVRDLCSTHPAHKTKRVEVERWIGTYPSRDFVEVVTLAGIDPRAVHDRLSSLCAQSAAQRHAFKDAIEIYHTRGLS